MKNSKWYNNSVKEIQLLDCEPIPDGYVRGRLPKPKKIDSLVLIVSKERLYDLYIIQNIPFHKLSEQLDITNKDLRLLLNHYDIRKNLKMAARNNIYKRTHEQNLNVGKKSSETQKKNWELKSQKEKELWKLKCKEAQLNMNFETKKEKTQKYINWWFGLPDEERAKINEKRSNSCKHAWEINGDEIQKKKKSTEKENRKNRLCRSVAEQKMFDCIVSIYPDVMYDVRIDDRYPYYVDFYIPSEDLFIELNAHPSHGKLPFKMMKFEDYKNYDSKWAGVFGKRDVEKQECAEKNNLNYIAIYPSATLEENKKLNNRNDNLIELLYTSQK